MIRLARLHQQSLEAITNIGFDHRSTYFPHSPFSSHQEKMKGSNPKSMLIDNKKL